MDEFPYLTIEDEDSYHARSRSGECVSSHMLATFRNSPFKYYMDISDPLPKEEKPEFAFGRAAHKMILEGEDAFMDKYFVSDGPVNPKTGEPFGRTTKAYMEWRLSQDKEIVSVEDFATIESMRQNIFANPAAAALLRTNGVCERVARANDGDILCQIRMDYFSSEAGIVDLKTCRDIDFFEKDMRDFGYAYQMAFYRRVLNIACGQNFPVSIIAVDKTDYNICGVWVIPDAELDECEGVNIAALRRLQECRDSGTWPTGYETERVFSNRKPQY